MECMSSQKKTSSCDQACSHVGLRNGLVLLSFAVCILFIWNICLQLKISSNSVSVNGCISINEAKKNAFKNSEPKNLEDKFMQNLSRKRRSGRQLRNRVTNLEAKVRSLEAAVMKKIVHLRMNQEMNDTVLYSRVDNIGHCPGNSPKPCLRWDTPNEFPHMFDYVKDGYNKPVAIKVLSPGIYTVYAQLAISGPDTSTRFDPIVGFEIFLIRGPGKFTLTKGLTTQDQRGRRYHNTEHRQVDTVFVMGTFKFFCDDMVYVSLLDSTNLSYRSDASYFGMIQGNPASALIEGNHACDP